MAARIASGPGMTVICSSSDPRQLRALLTVFDPTTIRGVISFGVAGGLDPSWSAGDLMLVTDHINLMGTTPLLGANDDALGPRQASPDDAPASKSHARDQIIVQGKTGQPTGVARQHFGRHHNIA